jgi:hypothetical protein
MGVQDLYWSHLNIIINQIKTLSAFKMTEDVTKLSKNAVPKYKTRYSAIHIVWGREAST